MKRFSCSALVGLAAVLGACSATPPQATELSQGDTPQADGWELVWSDDFEGETLDRTKWTPEVSCWGGGNEERQCYTDRPENIEVSDGFLHLKARPEEFTGPDRPPEIAGDDNGERTKPYTSGKVRTRGLHSWKFARVDVRAKPPGGQGAWPAVWMMPADDHYGRWPLSGEIDILEAVNLGAECPECEGDVGENRTTSALHFGDVSPKNAYVDHRTTLPSKALPSEGFHVWSVEWGEGLLRFFLDGRLHFEVTPEEWWTASEKAKGNPNAPFDQPFYLMANLAVGGAWPERDNEGGVDASAFPSEFIIDWVRVYQCEGDRETGRACMQ